MRLFLFVVATLIFFAHSLQILSPLRMTTDSVEYLLMAASAADGKGFVFHGQPTQHPPGYPAMIALLDRIRIARPWSLVGLNCAFLLVGLIATYFIAQAFGLSAECALVIVALTQLSFLIVRNTPLILSDIPFFGVSLASLALMIRVESRHAEKWKTIGGLILAALLVAASSMIRSIGVTLIPALIWCLLRVSGFDSRLLKNKRMLAVTLGSVVVVGTSSLAWFFHTRYGAMFVDSYLWLGGIVRTLSNTVVLRLMELGVVVLNVPPSKVPVIQHVRWMVGLVGLTSLMLLAAFVYRRRKSLNSADVYMLACLLGLLLTPWAQDSRYWIPALPLVLAAILGQLMLQWKSSRLVRLVVRSVGTLYLGMGLAAFAYSTYVTFSGSKFPDVYGGGTSSFAQAYRLVLFGQNVPSDHVDPDVVLALRRYAQP